MGGWRQLARAIGMDGPAAYVVAGRIHVVLCAQVPARDMTRDMKLRQTEWIESGRGAATRTPGA